jgi:CHAD domain-containing protein
MAKRKEPDSGIRPADVRETLRRQIGDASRTLREPALTDKAIHKARKDLKRARANLRLLRKAVGGLAYTRTNAALRDAARPLSSVRDAKVMAVTLDSLLERETNAARRALLVKLHGVLEQARVAAMQEMEGAGEAEKSASALEQTWGRVDRWRVPAKRPSLVRSGIRRIYRRAREALAAVRSECSPENLHEWRKQVKYLSQALESFRPTEAPAVAKRIKRAEAVADALGQDHDLVMLQKEVTRLHASSNARTGLFTEIAQRRQALQAKALNKSRGLFKEKPGAFVKTLRKP